MIIANKIDAERFMGLRPYDNGNMHDATAAKINKAIWDKCGVFSVYAARIGVRGAVTWVSVGSSCRIGRGEAAQRLAWENIKIEDVEGIR